MDLPRGGTPHDHRVDDPDVAAIAGREVDASIRWLWDHATADPQAPAYGLVLDRDDVTDRISTAATGFALAAWCIGLERGVLTREEVLHRSRGAVASLERLQHRDGLMVHFADAHTGARSGVSEYSTIDTALALSGAVVASQVLADHELTQRTAHLLERAAWHHAIHQREGTTLQHMARVDSSSDDYGSGADGQGWVGAWGMCAEQLGIYVLAAGHPKVDPVTARQVWEGFDRPLGTFGGHTLVYEPGGTLFVYHFPHAFWPVGTDPSGLDWWHNTREASAANRAWCREAADRFPTFADGLWGTAAGLGPWGYVVNGAEPATPPSPHCDGTIPPASLMGSLPFLPAQAGATLLDLYRHHPQAWDERYGWCDGINLGAASAPRGEEGRHPGRWFAPARCGLNKGASALLGAAALGSTVVWDAYESHPWTARGIAVLGLTRAR